MKSMTAFGRAVAALPGYEVTVELRSVNNRYLDWNIRLPRAFTALEDRVKTTLTAAGVTRGKVDVYITIADTRFTSSDGRTVSQQYEADLPVAQSYRDAAATLAATLGLENDLTVSRLLELPGVMVPMKQEDETLDDDGAWGMISPVLTEAAAQFMAARQREGDRLGADVQAKLIGIRGMVAEIEVRSKENVRSYRTHFEERLRAILDDNRITPDENRILTECAIYTDRVAIDEELVRLSSHFDALEELFASNEAVGRRIDFMLQETNREVNTIGSKCSDAAMSHTVADIKSELEKIREQIQNIE